jgi:hypothetical protein
MAVLTVVLRDEDLGDFAVSFIALNIVTTRAE